MANYTYTVIFADAELAFGEGESFEFARDEALEQVPSVYPLDCLEYVSTCDSGAIRHVSGPCFI